MNGNESVASGAVDLFDQDRQILPAEHLLVLPLSFRVCDGRVLFDRQSRDSLLRYLKWFKSIILAGPLLPESKAAAVSARKNLVWVPSDDLYDRVQFVPLPEYGSILKFVGDYRSTARWLDRCIDVSQYLQFAIGGGNGGLEHDWAAVAAELTMRKGRKFSVLADFASSDCIAVRARASRGFVRRKLWIKEWLVRRWQQRIVSRCDLMFCNGMETYQAFAPICRSRDVAVKFNDFQVGPEMLLPVDRFEAKCRDVASRRDLRICYAGRADPHKGPIDWVHAVAEARRLGADVKGVWLGTGTAFEALRQEVVRLGLEAVIELPGFVADRDQVFERIRDSDVMMFAHQEPESPRVLIESLLSATPIVGYEGLHPADLISSHQGGLLTPPLNPKALGAAFANLADDRGRLVELVRRAHRDGARFDSEIMTRERSDLIKQRLA